MRLRLKEIGSRETLALIGELEQRLAAAFPAGGPIEARLTGEAYVNARAITTLIRDLFYSLLTASLVIFTMLFAALFRFLPDAKVDWSDASSGAVATTVLFWFGQWALGHYLAWSKPTRRPRS